MDLTFRQWLHIHTLDLRTYKADEIVRVALACGFDFKEICHELFYWYMSLALHGCVTEFYEQWAYLQMYEKAGWDWDIEEAA